MRLVEAEAHVKYMERLEESRKILWKKLDKAVECFEYISACAGHEMPCKEKEWAYCDAGCEFKAKADEALKFIVHSGTEK